MKNFHESPDSISKETKDFMRALNSLKEEIEAIDWYQQRMDAATDKQLKKILKHNRDEEMEHACMVLEWLRRNMDGWEQQLKAYLFSENEIVKAERK